MSMRVKRRAKDTRNCTWSIKRRLDPTKFSNATHAESTEWKLQRFSNTWMYTQAEDVADQGVRTTKPKLKGPLQQFWFRRRHQRLHSQLLMENQWSCRQSVRFSRWSQLSKRMSQFKTLITSTEKHPFIWTLFNFETSLGLIKIIWQAICVKECLGYPNFLSRPKLHTHGSYRCKLPLKFNSNANITS